MSRYLDGIRNVGKVRAPDFIGSRGSDINLLALRSGVRARCVRCREDAEEETAPGGPDTPEDLR